jgi:hypothetical protein
MAGAMTQIPFTVDDFFGILAAGFIVLVATDYAFGQHWLLSDHLSTVAWLFWIVVAYIAGHLVANLAGHFFEEKLVRGRLGFPDDVLFGKLPSEGWKNRFPDYCKTLPEATQTRVVARAKQAANIEQFGTALFYHCFEVVKTDPATRDRLNTFLNL